jgi:hypothetical protein
VWQIPIADELDVLESRVLAESCNKEVQEDVTHFLQEND